MRVSFGKIRTGLLSGTPKVKASLCGHATLASAFVLFRYVGNNGSKIIFETKGGELKVKKNVDLLREEDNHDKQSDSPVSDNLC